MQWEKRGLIFDPSTVSLPNDCHAFAQSPQALVFDDFVRIYFSTRAVDPTNGKYLSHVAFVDMDRALGEVRGVSSAPVIPLGGRGTFDEHGIFPFHVVRHGNAILAYTCGWSRRVAVSVETGIGLAISHDDGRTFERVGEGPVLTSSLREPFLVGDGFVRVVDGTFHMWYIFGTEWKRSADSADADRVYKIGHARSTDGRTWLKDEGRCIVADRIGPDECQALPTVARWEGRWHMVFCYRHAFDFRANPDRGYRLGYAWSDDLETWTRDDDRLGLSASAGDWDADMQCYPHLFECGGSVYLLYNGNAFGRHGFGAAVLKQ